MGMSFGFGTHRKPYLGCIFMAGSRVDLALILRLARATGAGTGTPSRVLANCHF
jgi:hypothetical protein